MLRTWGFLAAAAFAAVPAFAEAQTGATPVESIHHLPGFEVELLYSVPREEEGSWVSLTVDDKGRLITCDQYGILYRITPPPAGIDLAKNPEAVQVEPIELELGMAQGLLYAFDSLYVSVNANNARGEDPPKVGSGLYRVRDTDGDDMFDAVEKLRAFDGSTEHGPHGLALSPDGKSIYVCAGNHTKAPDPESSVVPRVWDEDFLLSRMWDARGHARGRMAPGGWIAKTDPDGKSFELISIGFRNEYDIDFNAEGELFTYDADMEWDIGTPWYRPTRVNHVTSGSEFGWRSGTGKWPEYYPDSLGSVVDIGPGSPTGIVFGTGAKFPAKYQRALFIADWSYGIIYAVHLNPDGATYTGEAEKFLAAQPLPVTDMVVHPDGNLYFTIGGRQTQSGLYRVKYTGEESIEPAKPESDAGTDLRALRREIEQHHRSGTSEDVAAVWDHLNHDDRTIRFAARVALEHQPVDLWRDRVSEEKRPRAAIQSVIALARHGNSTNQPAAIATLNRIDWEQLPVEDQLDLLRAYSLVFIRLGMGDEESRRETISKLDGKFPAKDRRIDRELAALLIKLEAPHIAERVVAQLKTARTQEDQIHFALVLKDLKAGWSPDTRSAYFQWFNEAAAHRGGMSFGGFLSNIRDDAVSRLTEAEQQQLKPILEAKVEPIDPIADLEARPLVKKYTVRELLPIVEEKLHDRDFENGRNMFAVAACYKCHRIRGEGGSVGPDLTGVGGRFNNQNLLESLLEPSKVVSDQYEQTQFVMDDGRVITGRVINLSGNELRVMTNMLDPGTLESVDRAHIELQQPAATSMMPESLLDRLTEAEILDLIAFLKSGGDPNHEVFGETMKTTDSGLQYRIINPGNGEKPTPADTVVCHYKGWLEDGTEFDSSYARGEPAQFPLSGVIKGWTEGLQLIAPGGKIELKIPPELGYGPRGAGGVIPPNATLNFEVELIEVQ
jgi:putative heme-binding domain-containing protein